MSQFVSATACDGVLWSRIHNRPSKRCGKIIFSLDNNSDSERQNLLIIHCRVSWSGILFLHNKILPNKGEIGKYCINYWKKIFWLPYIVSTTCISSLQPVCSVASVVLCTAHPSRESNLLFLNVFRRPYASIAL